MRLFRFALLGLLLAVAFLALPGAATAQSVWGKPPTVPLFDTPRELYLCGERVPLERQDVWENMDTALIIAVYNEQQVVLWIKRAQRFFPYIERRLRERNMPDDLKYVAVAESALRVYATSSAKAVGPWQFMEGTGKKYGLRVDKWVDERLHFEKATEAAINYLSDLRRMFGSWNLAIAAYNCGENKMNRNTGDQGSRHFYDTDLPLETEAYIFRILAAKLILSNPEAYGFHIPLNRRYPPLAFEQVSIRLGAKETPITALAKAAGTTYKALREMNPQFRRDVLPAGTVVVKVPQGSGARVRQAFGK